MTQFNVGSWISVLLGVAIAVSSLSSQVSASRSLLAQYPGGYDSTLSSGLSNGFYWQRCPNVEYIVYNSMRNSFSQDSTVAPGVLRLAFHDCFVRGCDASVLLTGPHTEQASPVNSNLHGFDAIEAAKEAVEQACPGVVSCADIMQFAARDSVILTGGQGWAVPAGRRDGTVSNEAEPIENLPAPQFNVFRNLPLFQNKGLSADQLVVLSGAHTIGIAHCNATNDRLFPTVDPSLSGALAASLKNQCPSNSSSNANNLDLVTPRTFDSRYYQNILQNNGLLTSDQSLLDDDRTSGSIYANNGESFAINFGNAMIAMSQVDVLTGQSGQIRQICSAVNQ